MKKSTLVFERTTKAALMCLLLSVPSRLAGAEETRPAEESQAPPPATPGDDLNAETGDVEASSGHSAADDSAATEATVSISNGAESAAVAETSSGGGDQEVPPAEKQDKKETSWTDLVTLKGDFRYRFEIIDTENMEMRYRHRIRARVGLVAEVVDSLEIGVQAASGSSDPVSTNQTLDEAFSSKPIQLDLAYAAWSPTFAEGLALTAGKMSNPFFSVGKSELLWDGDLNPEGVSLGYERAFGMAEPFISAAGFFVEERSGDEDSWLLGAQGGLKLSFLDGALHVLGGAGYFDHTTIKGSEVYFDPTDNMGNSAEMADPEDPESSLLYVDDYNIVEGFLEVGGKIAKFPWGVFGGTAVNVAASDDNIGWLVGASFGKVKEALDFDLRYIYKQVDKDAVVGIFTDSDFRDGGTDGKGHEWNLGFGVAKHVSLAATYFLNERPLRDNVERPGETPESGTELFHRFQLDFQLKF